MRIHPFFPEARLQDPKRQAELMVYGQLEACDAPGVAIYEARPDRSCTECDFAVWLTDVARFGVQVKGGHYTVERGIWYLATPAGPERMPSPMKQCWDACMGLNRFLQGRIEGHRNPFIVPVLAFPDMDENEEIEAWASQSRIHVLWGAERLGERLIEMADDCHVYFPPTAEEIAEQVELVMPGLGGPEPPQPAVQGSPLDLDARQVIIQHAAVVNVYTTGAGLEPPSQEASTAV